MTLEKLSRMLMALAGVSFLPAIFVIAPNSSGSSITPIEREKVCEAV